MKTKIIRCERCNAILEPKKVKWLELSESDGNYYNCGKLPQGHVSQGAFSFGTICATQQLKETIERLNCIINLSSDKTEDLADLAKHFERPKFHLYKSI